MCITEDYSAYRNDAIGEYFELNIEDAEKLKKILNANYISFKYISGCKIYYYYSPRIKYKIDTNFNIQIVIKKDKIIVGVPIIFSEI